jgi:hypothetical protein
MSEEKKTYIRNSTAEFLIFTGQSIENSIEVRVAEESVWLTQKLMGILFEASLPTINEHLNNLFRQNEISKNATIRNFRIVQKEGSREVARNIEFYSPNRRMDACLFERHFNLGCAPQKPKLNCCKRNWTNVEACTMNSLRWTQLIRIF